MSTPSTDGLKLEIDAGRLRTGNQVQVASGLPAVTTLSQLYIDSSSNLQVAEAITASQTVITTEAINLTGTAATGILTQTFVGSASVTTATIAGYVRVKLTNSGTGLTSGSYYLPVYTLV